MFSTLFACITHCRESPTNTMRKSNLSKPVIRFTLAAEKPDRYMNWSNSKLSERSSVYRNVDPSHSHQLYQHRGDKNINWVEEKQDPRQSGIAFGSLPPSYSPPSYGPRTASYEPNEDYKPAHKPNELTEEMLRNKLKKLGKMRSSNVLGDQKRDHAVVSGPPEVFSSESDAISNSVAEVISSSSSPVAEPQNKLARMAEESIDIEESRPKSPENTHEVASQTEIPRVIAESKNDSEQESEKFLALAKTVSQLQMQNNEQQKQINQLKKQMEDLLFQMPFQEDHLGSWSDQ